MSDVGSQFSINWGNAKEPTVPPEGNYDLEVAEYELRTPKKPESAAHGFNIYIKFKILDAEELGIGEKYRIHHWIYFDVDDPSGAKPFFDAIAGSKLNDDSTLDPRNPNMFIGERVKAVCKHDTYDRLDDDGNVIETKTTLKVKSNRDFYAF